MLQSDEIEVWPENWEAYLLFDRIRTQWRVGAGGATGLDYNVLFHVMEKRKLEAEEWDEMLLCIQAIEEGALAAMHQPDE